MLPLAVLGMSVVLTFVIPFRPALTDVYCICFLGAFAALSWHVFVSRQAESLAMTIKGFFVVAAAPPALLLLGQTVLGARPHLAYPVSLRFHQWLGPYVEFTAYGVALGFIAAFVMGADHRRRSIAPAHDALRHLCQPHSALFWFFLIQSVLYSSFQFLSGEAVLLRGGYGLDESEHLLGINAWNAMGTLTLILAAGFRDRREQGSLTFLWLAGAYLIVVNLLHGNRADIIGLALVGVVMAARRRIQIKNSVTIGVMAGATACVAIAVAALRSRTGADDVTFRAVIMPGDFWYFPSVNDFFGSLPLTISYMQYDGGELWLGRSYYLCLTSLLPAAVNPWRIDESASRYLLENYWQYNGGLYLPAEIWINFGVVGVFAAAPLLGRFLSWMERKLMRDPTFPRRAIVWGIIAGMPRWILYGSSTFSKQLFLIGLFWLAAMVISVWLKRKIQLATPPRRRHAPLAPSSDSIAR